MRALILVASVFVVGCGNLESTPQDRYSIADRVAVRNELHQRLTAATAAYEQGRRTPEFEQEKAKWGPIVDDLKSQLDTATEKLNSEVAAYLKD